MLGSGVRARCRFSATVECGQCVLEEDAQDGNGGADNGCSGLDGRPNYYVFAVVCSSIVSIGLSIDRDDLHIVRRGLYSQKKLSLVNWTR